MPAFMPTILNPPLYSSVPLAAALVKAFKENENDASTVLSPTGQQDERLAEDKAHGWRWTFLALRSVYTAAP